MASAAEDVTEGQILRALSPHKPLTRSLSGAPQPVVSNASANGRFIRPQGVKLSGKEISFVLPDGKNISRFSGRVNGEAMEGMVDLPGGKGMVKWTAVRTAEAKVVME